MQTIIIGSNSPAKITLMASLVLESPLNTMIDIQPQEAMSWDTTNVNCAIYVDSEPNIKVIEQLRDTALPLILVTSGDSRQYSDLFVPLEDFTDSMLAVQAVCNIKKVIAASNSKQP